MKDLLKRLVREEDGQGLVEYTLMLVLVALVFWVVIKQTNIADSIDTAWKDIKGCVDNRDKAGC